MASYEAMIVVKKLELTYRDSELATRVRANSDPRES
jgi:hypothetical protein